MGDQKNLGTGAKGRSCVCEPVARRNVCEERSKAGEVGKEEAEQDLLLLLVVSWLGSAEKPHPKARKKLSGFWARNRWELRCMILYSSFQHRSFCVLHFWIFCFPKSDHFK